MPKVIIPSPFRQYADNQREVTVDGDSLKEAMDRLLLEYPQLEAINNDSALLSVFINGKLIRTNIEEWDTLILNSEDEITLIIPIAGG
jgi:molybdopterin converting factor small subunit